MKRVWLAANLPCSKRLKAVLPLWLLACAQEFNGLPLDIVKILRRILASSIDRLLSLRWCVIAAAAHLLVTFIYEALVYFRKRIKSI